MFEEILKKFHPYLDGRYLGDRWILKRSPELCKEILEATKECPENLMLRGRIELLRRGLTKIPQCPICSKPIRFMTDVYKWSEVCSVKCAVKLNYQKNGEGIKAKLKETMMNRYGVEYGAQVAGFKEKYHKTSQKNCGEDHHLKTKEGMKKFEERMLESTGFRNPLFNPEVKEKIKQTMLDRYGVTNPARSPELRDLYMATLQINYGVGVPMKSKEIRDRYVQTSLANWGTESPSKHPQVKEKYKNSCLSKYGVDNVMKSPVIKKKVRIVNLEKFGPGRFLVLKKIKETLLARYGVTNCMQVPGVIDRRRIDTLTPEIVNQLESKDFWDLEYTVRGKSFLQISLDLNISDTTVGKYFKLQGLTLRPSIFGYEEQTLRDIISRYYSNEKTTLKNLGGNSRQELDIFIPELKIAFEYNGLEWHQEKYRDSNYHLSKTLDCQKLGIRLIHIWSDDWHLMRSLMERKILALLGQERVRIYARKCKIVVPSSLEKRIFLDENHIKGDGSGSISYALKYLDEIVALITFRKTGLNKYDLNRYATSRSVVGGFSKLLEHFKRIYRSGYIYTYADLCWSTGNLYHQTGFKLTSISGPAFYGIELGRRINRLKYTHPELRKRFPELSKDGLSQFQIMDLAGIPRIWDCGNLKFEMLF